MTNDGRSSLDASALERVLEVTRRLGAPFELDDMLREVIDAGRAVLHADRGTVFLYDSQTEELIAKVATGLDPIRVPLDRGIVGEAARTRDVINVPDCYADPRFNREVDKKSNYRTRCLLTVPLIGYDQALVGVLQLLNKEDGVFNDEDERIAVALAAQCAVALQRVRMTEELMIKEKLERELSVARDIQQSILPRTMPQIAGYDIGGLSLPADETGGDTFDIIARDDGHVLVLLGDATGHGIGPALSVTQVRAMLRMAARLGADLDRAYANINDQLVDDLPDNRFVTAFLGLLDPSKHRMTYHSGGQGPLMHFHAASGEFDWLSSTTMPMGFMEHMAAKDSRVMDMAPGDIVGLITDGVYECENPQGKQFEEAGVAQTIREGHLLPMEELSKRLLELVLKHQSTAPQADDITIVLVRRLPAD